MPRRPSAIAPSTGDQDPFIDNHTRALGGRITDVRREPHDHVVATRFPVVGRLGEAEGGRVRPAQRRFMTSQVIDRVGHRAHVVGMEHIEVSSAPLRRALLGNAAFSTCTGSVLTIAPEIVAPWLGQPPPSLLRALGVGLLSFAALLVWQARGRLRLAHALATVVADLGWVVGSGVLLAVVHDDLPGEGVMLIAGVAGVVAMVALAQLRGMACMVRGPDERLGTLHRYEVTVDVEAPAGALWKVVSDLSRIGEHSDGLADVSLTGDLGPGAIRRCTDRGGKRWAEEVTGWNEGTDFQLRFRSEDAGFPFPMDPMFGGWTLNPTGEQTTRLTVWWSFTTQPVWAAPVIVALLDARMPQDMTSVMHSMARQANRSSASAPTASSAPSLA